MYRKKNSRGIIKGIIYAIALLLQVALIVTVFVINNLTAKRAGVMRHVYTKRLQYEQGIFTQVNLTKHNIILIALCILFAVLLFYAIKRRQKIFTGIQIAIGIMMSLLTIIVINSKYFIDILAYPYFIIAFELALLIQTIIIIIVILQVYQYNKRY
ncbi:hypothetical protein DW1_0655 [Proteiniborus sp. DW1]|uniref:hypothetical protein n=1 Tax=Proteiniborus sp. DW1 TaxID=1889883 RepID=UPI00092E13FC|nr:hypothetical protein [Proteiniborus sp. DW1]SCG82264.1 hypothetical protein DW1_0655 [Proteiniborus sp. DW1]